MILWLPRLLRKSVLLILFALWIDAPALAAVEVSFYSRELGGNHFPHAFVHLTGTDDPSGARVDETIGFTATSITPALLWGPVKGEVITEKVSQLARSTRQFSVTLTDDQYRAVQNIVADWRNRDQPSYDLNKRNCIHFVAEIAAASGLRVEYPPKLMKKPRSFLLHVKKLNPLLASAP